VEINTALAIKVARFLCLNSPELFFYLLGLGLGSGLGIRLGLGSGIGLGLGLGIGLEK